MPVDIAGVTNVEAATATLDAARPTGADVNGAAMVAVHRPGFGIPSSPPSSSGAAWTLWETVTINANHKMFIYRKQANNEPASESWTNTAGGVSCLTVIAYSGAHPTTPFHLISAPKIGGESNTEIDCPSITTTVDGCKISFGVTEGGGNNPTVNWPAGVTERADQGAIRMSVATEDAIKSPAGATTVRRATMTTFTGAANLAAITWAIAPAPSTTTVGTSRSLNYATRSLVAASRVTGYDKHAVIGAARSMPYAKLAAIAVSRTLPYSKLTFIAASRNLLYAKLAVVGSSRTLPYDKASYIGVSRSLLYSLAGMAGASRLLPYSLVTLAAVGTSRALPYSAYSLIGSSRILTYGIHNVVGESRVLPYSGSTPVGASRVLVYSLSRSVFVGRVLLYRVNAVVTTSRLLRYAVHSSLPGGVAARNFKLPFSLTIDSDATVLSIESSVVLQTTWADAEWASASWVEHSATGETLTSLTIEELSPTTLVVDDIGGVYNTTWAQAEWASASWAESEDEAEHPASRKILKIDEAETRTVTLGD